MRDYHLYFASCVPAGGIHHYTFRNGALRFGEKTACDRPMYLDVAPDGVAALLRQPFAGSRDSGLMHYPTDAGGRLLEPGPIIDTRGVVACHLCRFEGETYVTNYLSGSVFCTSGRLDVHSGRGVHPARQEAPHTHFISPAPDGACLLSTDLGLDAIYRYDRELRVLGVVRVPSGQGPRHLACSPDGRTVFCCNELGSTVTVLRYTGGELTVSQTVSVLDHEAPSTAAAIRVRGEYVYVSNRGDDSISCLRWDGERLALCSVTPCAGRSPRDFLIVEDYLFCANEASGNVTVFRVDGPRIADAGIRLEMETPLCVVARPF